jgi:UDP-glucose 4-epimerase
LCNVPGGDSIRVLVTGGAGFIGSHICEHALHEGHDVVCVDNFDPYYDPLAKERNIGTCIKNGHFTLHRSDIRDRTVLASLLEDIDIVFHEAAQPGVRISVENPFKTHEVNSTGTLNLLKAALDSDVKKIINASSSSVYGNVHYLPFDEDHPLEPVSPYGVSKVAAEGYCQVFSRLYGLKTISLRYFTVYGPRMRPDLAINIFMRQAFANNPLPVYGDGTKTRDFTHVEDIVRANFLAIERGEGACNIGGGHQITIRELAEKIIEITGSSSIITYSDPVKGDAEHTHANYEKAEHELGWTPEVRLEDGLMRYAEWASNCQR